MQELVLGQLDALPTLPAVAVRLLELTSSADAGMADVVRVLRGDQPLTARMLSAASAASTGGGKQVTTVDRAVAVLGFKAVRNIALATSVFQCFPNPTDRNGDAVFVRTEFWKHALGVACAARGLAAARGELGIDPEEAYVAGLLHDLGKVALDAAYPKAYERAIQQALETRCDIVDAERAVLGADHTVAGRYIAERWRLPAMYRDVAWLHHLSTDALPSTIRHPRLIALVQLADTLVREHRLGFSGNLAFYRSAGESARALGFGEASIEAVVARLAGEVADEARLLGLDNEPPQALYVRALGQANEELGRLNLDLNLSNRKLATGDRYFRAISQFDRQLGAGGELADIARAAAVAGRIVLQRPRVAAFALREMDMLIDLAWSGEGGASEGSDTCGVSAETRAWLLGDSAAPAGGAIRCPPELAPALAPAARALGPGPLWLLTIVHEDRMIGGLVYVSAKDERGELAGELEELRLFLTSIGLALTRARVLVASRRLAEDLAEANRRLQQMQVELLRSRTLAMIANMAAGAGHELNGPLAVISGRAQMLCESAADPDVARVAQMIASKAHECSNIVSELLEFARPRPPQQQAVPLADMLFELREGWIAAGRVPAARLHLDMSRLAAAETLRLDGVAKAWIDREQIARVLDELLRNACDAIAENDGSITIGAGPGPSDNTLEVTIRDTGCGMSTSVLQRAFDPFFSHRKAGRGRGLGLARAYRIVESHGGRVWLDSRPDAGTTAHVILPRATSADGRSVADARGPGEVAEGEGV